MADSWIEGQDRQGRITLGREHDFPKLSRQVGGQVRIKDNPPLIFHPDETGATDFHRMVKGAFHRYRSTLIDERRALLDRYRVKDVAIKVVGVGSVGTRCWIVLLMAGDNDPLFLQVKEAREIVLEPYAGKSRFWHHGERVVRGQRLMQAATICSSGGRTSASGSSTCGSCATQVKPPVETFDAETLDVYANACGWALARAHAKASESPRRSADISAVQATRSTRPWEILRWPMRIRPSAIMPRSRPRYVKARLQQARISSFPGTAAVRWRYAPT